ncbi:MAG: hypothetical protein JNN24_03165 [Hyphomicrobium zavarzinii]|uniref:hypothetical protein n=1 Tax=Hyphomicrobium zavarzinii TaxID=48292 RepID=UPI001A49389A|nr:hypothetical protein [Hyphomicrobium zavarzinii]MBL8844749.1 hypothetical protein [Hyphomicrobium zavarzinii]
MSEMGPARKATAERLAAELRKIAAIASPENADALIPMGRENDGDTHVTAYMCLVDFECEAGLASGGNRVYPSIEDIREHRKCVAGCGIVEVEIRATRVVQEPSDEGDVVFTSAEIEALSAAPQPPTVSTQGWQDISTAPRDGRWFLICREDEGPESYEVGCFDPQTWSAYEPAENGLYRKVERVVNEWRGFNNFHRATHWTALLGHPGDPDLSTLTRERDQTREALELAEPILAAVSMLLREDRILVCRDEILTAALQRARSVLHPEEGQIDSALSAAPAPEAVDGERS